MDGLITRMLGGVPTYCLHLAHYMKLLFAISTLTSINVCLCKPLPSLVVVLLLLLVLLLVGVVVVIVVVVVTEHTAAL